MLWSKGAPEFGKDDDQTVCDYIDKYVSCNVPEEEGKLKELVTSLQTHKHSSYCKRRNTCRFKFSHPPSTRTLIAQPSGPDNEVSPEASEALKKVRKLIIDGKSNITLNELLELANVNRRRPYSV